MNSVRNAVRKLKKKGITQELQKKLDEACVAPHIHPRCMRNDTTEG